MTYDGYSWCKIWFQIWPNPQKLQSRTTNVLQVWLCSWCTFDHARELKMGIKLNNDIWCNVQFDTKYDQSLQNSSQGPPMSSMYDIVLDALIIMPGVENLNTTHEWKNRLIQDVIFDIKDNSILQNSSQEPPTSSK